MTRLDRRTLLGTVGTGLAASFAGCGFLGGNADDPVELDPDDLREALSTPTPEYTTPVPVTPAQSAIRASLDRTDELLAAVPADLTPSDVPNGAIRQRIQETRESAVEERERATERDSAYRRLRRTRYARRDAAEAAVAFKAVEGETTLEEVRAERDALSETVTADLDDVAYVGGDWERTLYVTQRLEYDLLGASRWLDYHLRAVDPSALDVGKLGGRVEYARATSAVVEHLSDRHRARSGTQRFGDTFERALDGTIERASERSLPERGDEPADLVETEVGDGPRSIVLDYCLRELLDSEAGLRDRLADRRLAAGLQRAYSFERDYRACERIRARIGDVETLDGVDPLWEARERAIRLVTEVGVDPEMPTLPAAMLSRLADRIGDIDDDVRRTLDSEDEVCADDLEWPYADYVWVGEQLRALPDAVDAMASRFE